METEQLIQRYTRLKPKAEKRKTSYAGLVAVILVVIIVIAIIEFTSWFSTGSALFIQLYGFFWVAFALWLIKQIFASGWFNPARKMIAHGEGNPPPDYVEQRGFFDFFVGDDGRYSMVRLQVVAWAFTIISYQVAVLIALKMNNSAGLMHFKPVFTEEVLWLLGLSLGSWNSYELEIQDDTIKVILNDEPVSEAQLPDNLLS